MVIDIPISEIMTTQVISLENDESLKKAEHLMKKHHIRHLPITKNGNLVGMLSLTDLQRISFTNAFSEEGQNSDSIIDDMFNIDQIMTHHPVTIDIKEGMIKALEILVDKEFHALPIVNEGSLAGIITTTDAIKYLLKICEI